MKPIIRWTCWQRRWSTFWWSFGTFLMIFISMIFYPSFRDQAAELQKTFDQLPPAAVQLFGGSSDFFSPVGFLNSQIFFVTLPVLLAVLAIGLATSLIGKEEDSGTLETLLARPISRARLLAAKALAGTAILTFISFIAIATTVITCKIVSLDLPLTDIALAGLTCYLLSLCTGALVFLLAATGRGRNMSLGVGAFIAFGGYIISSLAGTVHWLKTPASVFPFNYYDPEAVLRQTYHWSNLIYFFAVIFACGLLAWISFRRRDLG
jgi:ABC-2 type transport system permease protein